MSLHALRLSQLQGVEEYFGSGDVSPETSHSCQLSESRRAGAGGLGQVPATKGSPVWSPAVHPPSIAQVWCRTFVWFSVVPELVSRPRGHLYMASAALLLRLSAQVLIYLFIWGFSEAGRPAALQPRHRGADHDHRVSGPAALPSGPAPAGDPRTRGAILPSMSLDLEMGFYRKRPP